MRTNYAAAALIAVLAAGSSAAPADRGECGEPLFPGRLFPADARGIIAHGDLDGDGHLDLVVGEGILFGHGDGTFTEPVELASNPTYLRSAAVVADLDGDGDADVAYAGSWGAIIDQGAVLVFRNAGARTFELVWQYEAGYGASDIAAADFDRDGRLDLAVANLGEGSLPGLGRGVSLLFGLGGCFFAPAVTHSLPGGVLSVDVADFNADFFADIAADIVGAEVVILPGLGDGTFDEPTFVSTTYSTSTARAADIDLDGDADLVVGYLNADTAGVLIGHGNGTFDAPVILEGHGGGRIRLGDLDGDGAADLVGQVPLGYDNGAAVVSLNDGAGSFGLGTRYFAGREPQDFAVGDFNEDGVPDLAIAATDVVGVLLGAGQGTLDAPLQFDWEPDTYLAATGDLDGDGDTDFVLQGMGIALSQGDGTFAAPVYYPVSTDANAIAVGDLDGDADLDVVAGERYEDTAEVFLNEGDATFVSAGALAWGDHVSAAHIADVDGDGAGDLIESVGYEDAVRVFPGFGDGSFSSPLSYATAEGPSNAAVGDLNADDQPDLVVACGSGYDTDGAVSVLLNQGAWSFVPADDYVTGILGSALNVALADLDADGDLDIAAGNYDSHGWNTSVAILLNNGDGSMAPMVTYDARLPVGRVFAGDLDADGHLDIAAGTLGVAFLGGTGDGTFSLEATFARGDNYLAAIGDLDGDGDLDLIGFDWASLNSACPRGDVDGDGVVGVNDFLAVLAAWGPCPGDAACPADLDGDGSVSVTDFLVLLAVW